MNVNANDIPDDVADAAALAENQFVWGSGNPLTARDLDTIRQSKKVAVAAALNKLTGDLPSIGAAVYEANEFDRWLTEVTDASFVEGYEAAVYEANEWGNE